MNVPERVSALRSLMKSRNIDAYLIPSSDSHQSEYVPDYFKTREFMTGFTGSAGTAVITLNEAALWTDGRYYIQAEKELTGSGITLYKAGMPGVCSIPEYLAKILPSYGTLGFDGKVMSASVISDYKKALLGKNIHMEYRHDLVGQIWKERPSLPKNPAFILDECYAGESVASKLLRLRSAMKNMNASFHVIAALDDIGWLFNIRGRDTGYTPVVLSYAFVSRDDTRLFIDKSKLDNNVTGYLSENHVILHPYDDIYGFVSSLPDNESILIDPGKINYSLRRCIPDKMKCIEGTNPCTVFKSVKNPVEIENIKKAHIKDGIAHTKFLYWLKNTYDKNTVTEQTASAELEKLRQCQENFLWPSFFPVSAYGPHAAMCHYSSSDETDVPIKAGGFYLTDTGGHYLEGSTDVTRTVAIGDIPEKWRADYTYVLKGNLALSRIHFLKGCSGENLDILARQFLWNNNLDYMHGTGHGIGYILNIHEGPCAIRWQFREEPAPLDDGMIVSDEPGIYVEGSHGIRLENELLIEKDTKNEYGQFLRFRILTCVPFDRDSIDVSLLTAEEKKQLNDYHAWVYETVSPYLNKDEAAWLADYAGEIR